MQRKAPKVTADIPLDLWKALHHKLIDEDRTVKEVVRQLIELWVNGEIVLPNKPTETKRKNGNAGSSL